MAELDAGFFAPRLVEAATRRLRDEIPSGGALAPAYRLWALATEPPEPGLLRVMSGGAAIVGERWRLPADAFGTFVAGLVAPMTTGPVELADGSRVRWCLVEPAAVAGSLETTAYGGWQGYVAAAARDR